jgi:transposase
MAMFGANVWRRVLGVDRATVIEDVDFDEESDTVVVHVRPRRSSKRRCGRCGARAPGYDQGEGRRNWRTLDLGTLRCFLQADSVRVNCPEHGPTVAQVPWARHGAGHTKDFDDTVAWLVTHMPKSTVSELMRIAWRTVGSIIERVVAEGRAAHDPFDGLTRIGIDEISYKRGHRYLTVVVDHDSGRLVWAGVGKGKATLHGFFDLVGDERCDQIRLVSADAAEWISHTVKDRCRNASLCIDPFHVVAWANKALDDVRRSVWNQARKGGLATDAKTLQRCRYALWRRPEDLSERQEAKLAQIAQVNATLYLAYLMKEQLRVIIGTKGPRAQGMLEAWFAWVEESQIRPFIDVARRIEKNRTGIEAALINNMSNGLVESTNTKLRVLHRMAFGFGKPEHLIALALLDRGGYCPSLPGRQAA